MKRFFRTAVLSVLMFAVSGVHCAFAQWNSKGCSDYVVNIANLKTFESSLWTFRSAVWDGYIDFQKNGKYWTHWGFGTWTVTPEGKIHMVNDYNPRTYDIVLFDNGFQYQGISSDGIKISGALICAQYEGSGPQVPEDVSSAIKEYYKQLLERDPDAKELEASFRQYNRFLSLDKVKETIMQTQEYHTKEAARAAAQAAAARSPMSEAPIPGY